MAPTAASFSTPVLGTCGPLHKSTIGPHLQSSRQLLSAADVTAVLLQIAQAHRSWCRGLKLRVARCAKQ